MKNNEDETMEKIGTAFFFNINRLQV